jgi:hypothetical protein
VGEREAGAAFHGPVVLQEEHLVQRYVFQSASRHC